VEVELRIVEEWLVEQHVPAVYKDLLLERQLGQHVEVELVGVLHVLGQLSPPQEHLNCRVECDEHGLQVGVTRCATHQLKVEQEIASAAVSLQIGQQFSQASLQFCFLDSREIKRHGCF
jgi:hypothetical protein